LRAKRGAFQAEKPGSVKSQRFRGVKSPVLLALSVFADPSMAGAWPQSVRLLELKPVQYVR
jgi:hypothetical protein